VGDWPWAISCGLPGTLNSVGVILPKDMLVRQHLEANDEIFAIDTPQGILLTAVDPATTAALDAYMGVAAENRAAMAALAKQ